MSELDYTTQVSAQEILDQLDGAQIASVRVEERTGLHLHFRDGRILVIVGLPDSSIGVQVLKTDILH
jgi:predicted Zn-dependent protease